MQTAKPQSASASLRSLAASAQPYFEGAYATMADPHSRESAHVTRRILVFFAFFAALVAYCALTWHIAWQSGIDELLNAAARVDRTTHTLKNTLDRYQYLPYLLSRHPIVQNALDHPDRANVDRVNHYLEDLNARAHATVTYLIARTETAWPRATGTAPTASSAWTITSGRISSMP